MYEKSGIGSSYMFRINKNLVIDATRTGTVQHPPCRIPASPPHAFWPSFMGGSDWRFRSESKPLVASLPGWVREAASMPV